MNTCAVCGHPQRAAIERALLRGGNVRFLAAKWGMTDDMVGRHRDGHMAGIGEKEAEVLRSRMDPAVLFEEHDECIRACRALIDYSQGEQDKTGYWIREPDIQGWALGCREWRGVLDQKNRILGLYSHIDPRLQRSFASRIVQVVARALEKFPEAKDQVLQVIEKLESEDGTE